MDPLLQSITWEAPAHYHIEKKSDWFWALGILTFAGAFTAIILGNFLFGLLILIAGSVMALMANREPAIIPFAVTTRGVRIDETLYPYSTLSSYYIETERGVGPKLLIKSERLLMPLIVIPLPEDHLDEIESILEKKLPAEHLEEPLGQEILEFLGF